MELHFPSKEILSVHLENHPSTARFCKEDNRVSQIVAEAFANSTKSAKDLRRWVVLATFDLWKNPPLFFIQNVTEALEEGARHSAL
jgi:hypothetical protein